ncbi:MAG: hypothetical protein JXR37_30705 [Kiritimatiellae bacterium]|nr:hypothetical protein [Kiritimatiellia bacterium]
MRPIEWVNGLVAWDEAAPDGPPGARGRLVLCASLAFGFLVAAFSGSTWQDAVETAQAVSGAVGFPAGNPVYLYHRKVYSLLVQVATGLLSAGFSEKTVSFFFSGLQGAFSFAALSMCAFGICRRPIPALAAPFVSLASFAYAFGNGYPIFMLGVGMTYGVIGLALLLLGVALVGADMPRTGAFVLGVLPGVHGALGLFGWVVLAALCVRRRRACAARLRTAWPFLLGGALIFFASFAAHRLSAPAGTGVAGESALKYYAAFLRNWDVHRQWLNLYSMTTVVGLLSLALCGLWLRAFRRDCPESAAVLFAVLLVSGVVGLSYAVLAHWVDPADLPRALTVLMPARFMNLNSLALAALLLGLLGRLSHRRLVPALTLVFLLQLALPFGRWLGLFQAEDHGRYVELVRRSAFVFMVATGLLLAALRGRTAQPAALPGRARGAARAVILVCTIIVLAGLWHAWSVRRSRCLLCVSPKEDAFWRQVGERPGVLITAHPMRTIQVRTRRPVLLNTESIDILSYCPEAGPTVQTILRTVYGVDLFEPPFSFAECRALWARRRPAEWRAIRRELGATDVLTYGDWPLQLPRVIGLAGRGGRAVWVLYHIPEGDVD